jgi:single-stranded DNA-binding protein
MATVTVVGTVTCKEGENPCTVRQFDSGNSVVSFSVLDKQYVYTKKGEEKFGQFYKCEVMGKAGQIAVDRLQRGDKVGVSGQLVQREYQGKIYLDIKNAQVTFLEYREDSGSGGSSDPF